MTLRTRLAVTFFLSVLLSVGRGAAGGVWRVGRRESESGRWILERQGEEREAARIALEARVVRSAGEIAGLLEARLTGDGKVDVPLALRAARLAELDVFHVQDAAGVVLGSMHWPEQTGSRSLLSIPGALTPFAAKVPDARSEVETILAGAPVRTPAGEIWILAGRFPPPPPSGLPGTDGAVPAVWSRSADRWIVLAALMLALSAAVVGVLLARILVRPVDEMVRAMDAVAEGKEDHDFPTARGDEFGPLVAAFSRMRSSLAREQARVRAAERVAAWREAARQVAHEIKNPLAPIRLTMENMIKARKQGADRFEAVFEDGARAVLEEVARLGRTVDAFSAYARMPAPEMRQVDLERILDSVVALFAGDESLRLARERCGGPVPIHGDPDLLGQALRNILSNCREAMGETGGEIRIRTSRTPDEAVLTVEDTGPGFDPGTLSKLFDPYFTTREEGTGLGMAITRRIAVEHGGRISAENREEGGARFTLKLPGSLHDRPN